MSHRWLEASWSWNLLKLFALLSHFHHLSHVHQESHLSLSGSFFSMSRMQLLYYLHILVKFASVFFTLKPTMLWKGTEDSMRQCKPCFFNKAGWKQEELDKIYCLSSTTPDASYPGIAQSFGSLPMPRLRAETFQRNRLPRTGFLLIPPLGQQALRSCSASARMAQAPAGHQRLIKVLSGDSYGNPWFPVPCFEPDKS